MKKPIKKNAPKIKNQKNAAKGRWTTPDTVNEVKLGQEVSEDFRETSSHELERPQADTSANWSQPEDRSEDLINETDPFTQQPEKDTQIPPELIQERAYYLYEQRGGNHGGNLADWFEAERQIHREKK